MELRLDIVGPMSGDMLVAALLDTFPRYESAVLQSIDAISDPYPVECRLEYVAERGVCGRCFIMEPYTLYFGNPWVESAAEREGWNKLRRVLADSSLPASVVRRAMAMLASLVRHQAARSDVNLDDVTFAKHEAWRMMVEAVSLAAIIDGLGSARWTASASGSDFASGFERAVLAYLGVLADHDDEPATSTGGPILVSGRGFPRERARRGGCYVRINGYETPGADQGKDGGRRLAPVSHPASIRELP